MPIPTQPNIDLTGIATRFWRRSKRIWLPVWADKNNNPIKTSAGQLPVKPYWELVSVAVLHCIIFKDFTDADYYAQFNALNSTTWRSFPRYNAWVANISTDKKRIGAGAGQATKEEVHYVVMGLDRPGGWRFVHPDVGYVYSDSGSLKSFTASGFPFIGNLDGSTGDKASPVTDMTLLSVDTKKEINFSSTLGF